jgi:hypothetical protein
MEKTESDYLASEIVRQFNQQFPTVSLDQNNLVDLLNSRNIPEHSKRMQYKLDKDQSHIAVHPVADLEVCLGDDKNTQYQNVGFGIDFQLRRVLLNWNTGYKESVISSALKGIEEGWDNSRNRGFDSEKICRKARQNPDIIAYMDIAFKAGHPYSVMGHFDEKVGSSKIGNWWVRYPVIIIPGLDDAGIVKVSEFCKNYQKPSMIELTQMGFDLPKLIK